MFLYFSWVKIQRLSLLEEKGMAKWCHLGAWPARHTQVIHIALADSKFSNSFPDHRCRAKHVWKVSSSSKLKRITCSSLSPHSSMMISNQTYMNISSYLMYPFLKTLEICETKHVWRFRFISYICHLWSKRWGCLNMPYYACIVKFSTLILSSWHALTCMHCQIFNSYIVVLTPISFSI